MWRLALKHRHVCACGDYYVCSQNRDHCAKEWTCPACEQQQIDEWAQTLDVEPEPDPQLTLNLTGAESR